MRTRTFAAHSEMRRAAEFRPSPETVIKGRVIKADSTTRWYHVCSVEDSTANGHPVTRRFLELFVKDFYSRPEPGPVYRGHVDAEGTPSGEEPPAAGWVLALELTDDGKLWALYELTDVLHSQIKTGGFRFNSIYGAVQFDDEGREVDAEFISIAVTNRPAVSNLLPMAASRGARLFAKGDAMDDEELIKDALRKLSETGEVTVDKLVRLVEAMKQQQGVLDGEGEATEESAEPAAMSAETEGEAVAKADEVELQEPGMNEAEMAAKEELFSLMSAAAAEAGTDLAGILSVLRDRMAEFVQWLGGTAESGMPSEETALSRKTSMQSETIQMLSRRVETAEKQVATLTAEKTAREDAIRREKAEGEVDELVKKGRLLETQRSSYVACALSDRNLFDDMVKSLPQVVPTGRVAADDGPAVTSGGDVDLEPRNEVERRFLAASRSPNSVKKEIIAEMRRKGAGQLHS